MDEERIKEIIIEQLCLDESVYDRELSLDILAVDSLDMMELAVALEEEFDISINDQQFNSCENIGQMVDLVMERIRD